MAGDPEDAPGGAAALPGSLAEAVAAFDTDDELKAAVCDLLGVPLVRAYMAVRAGEAEAAPSLADVLLRY